MAHHNTSCKPPFLPPTDKYQHKALGFHPSGETKDKTVTLLGSRISNGEDREDGPGLIGDFEGTRNWISLFITNITSRRFSNRVMNYMRASKVAKK